MRRSKLTKAVFTILAFFMLSVAIPSCGPYYHRHRHHKEYHHDRDKHRPNKPNKHWRQEPPRGRGHHHD